MSTIAFDLVSPEHLLYNDEVGMIIVPGKDGDIGVLPGHSKILSSLRPGRVMIYGENKSLLKSGVSVSIEKGSFGSQFLKFKGTKTKIRVKKLKWKL